MITLKINMVTTKDYYLQTRIVYCMTLKLKMPIKCLATIKKYLTDIFRLNIVKLLRTALLQNTFVGYFSDFLSFRIYKP